MESTDTLTQEELDNLLSEKPPEEKPQKSRVQELLEKKKKLNLNFEEMEKALLNALNTPTPPETKEQRERGLLEDIKYEYSLKNPYHDTYGVMGGPGSQWSFERHDRISYGLCRLKELGRQDLIDEYNAWVKEQEKLEEEKEIQDIKDNLKEAGIIVDDIKDENVKKYIIYLERNRK